MYENAQNVWESFFRNLFLQIRYLLMKPFVPLEGVHSGLLLKLFQPCLQISFFPCQILFAQSHQLTIWRFDWTFYKWFGSSFSWASAPEALPHAEIFSGRPCLQGLVL